MTVVTAKKTEPAPGEKDTRVATRRGGADSTPPGGSAKAAQNERAIRLLTELCDSLGTGARLPLHIELMERFGVSERAILRAFSELQRVGRILRKPRMGTIVAEPKPHSQNNISSRNGEVAALASDSLPLQRTIIAVARVDHSFFEYCLDLLCAYAEDRGDFTVLCKPLRSGEEPTPESLGALAVDPARHPFVLFGYHMTPVATYLRDRGANVVLVGTPLFGMTPEVPCIYGNQEFGGYLITQHLIKLGHRRIAFLHYDSDLPQSLRWQGFQRAVREARRQGIDIRDRYLPVSLDQWEADPTGAATLLQQPDSPTALMMWNDREALRLLSILRRAGIRVPEDVSVAGYDNLPESRTSYPSLTTVDPGVNHQLRAAVDLLTQPFEDNPAQDRTPAAPVATVVIPSLVTRGSTAPPLPSV